MVHQAKLPRSFWPAGTNPPKIETFSLTTLKRIIFSYYHLASGSEFWPAENQPARNRNFFFDSIKKDFLSFLSSGSEFWPAETNPPEIETFSLTALKRIFFPSCHLDQNSDRLKPIRQNNKLFTSLSKRIVRQLHWLYITLKRVFWNTHISLSSWLWSRKATPSNKAMTQKKNKAVHDVWNDKMKNMARSGYRAQFC